jgi:hypothetical protein
MSEPGSPRPSYGVRGGARRACDRVLVSACWSWRAGRAGVLQLSRPEMASGADRCALGLANVLSRPSGVRLSRRASGCGASAGAHAGCDAGSGDRARFPYLPHAGRSPRAGGRILDGRQWGAVPSDCALGERVTLRRARCRRRRRSCRLPRLPRSAVAAARVGARRPVPRAPTATAPASARPSPHDATAISPFCDGQRFRLRASGSRP